MKAVSIAAALAASFVLATTPAYAGRAVNTALGTLSGLVVFGPVGAVAGGLVGYTAGKGISRSWGLSRSHRRPPQRRWR